MFVPITRQSESLFQAAYASHESVRDGTVVKDSPLRRALGPAAWQVPGPYEYTTVCSGTRLPDLIPEPASRGMRGPDVWLRRSRRGFRFDAIPYLVEEGNDFTLARYARFVRQLGNAFGWKHRVFTVGEMTDYSPGLMRPLSPTTACTCIWWRGPRCMLRHAT